MFPGDGVVKESVGVMNFYVAMQGMICRTDGHPDDETFSVEAAIFIVTRIGRRMQRLSISRSTVTPGSRNDMPIRPDLGMTVIGTSNDENGEGRYEVFLLERTPPEEIAVEGTFLPAEGYARLDYRSDGIDLHAVGCDPQRRSGGWIIRARYVPWESEIRE